jgi:pumilio RNA-binding family
MDSFSTGAAAAAAANAAAPGYHVQDGIARIEVSPNLAGALEPADSGKRSGGNRGKEKRSRQPQHEMAMTPGYGNFGQDQAAQLHALQTQEYLIAQQALQSAALSGYMNPYMPPSPFMASPYGMPGMYPGMTMPGIPSMYGGMGAGMHAGSPYGGGGASPKSGGQAPGAKGQGRAKTGGRRRAKGKGEDAGPEPMAEDLDPNMSKNLMEVRKSGLKIKLTIKDLKADLLEFAQDQSGSKYLQSKLDEASPEERQEVLSIISQHAPTLANDAFGNFVIQKFFDIGTADQKKALLEDLLPKVLTLSTDQHGCRVVQKAITSVPRWDQVRIAERLQENVIGCIESMHGNHVIQKCIQEMPPESVSFIIKAVQDNAEKMASHIYGCRVVQRLLEHCASTLLETLLNQILKNIATLAQCPYGNYVVQHMLEHGRLEDKKQIIDVVITNIVDFSKHKCSSNVVEKALEISTVGCDAKALEADRKRLMKKVIGADGDPNPPLRQMMDDKFGNFIVQRMIEHARGDERILLCTHLADAEQQLKNSSHGRHILAALNKESKEMS